MLYLANLVPNCMSPIEYICVSQLLQQLDLWALFLGHAEGLAPKQFSFLFFSFFRDGNFESEKHVPTPENVVLISFSEAVRKREPKVKQKRWYF